MMALVVGGSASGKSACAEDLACRRGAAGGRGLAYVATMRPRGEGARARIGRHRARRAGRGFALTEAPTPADVAAAALDGRVVLLDDLGNLLANELYADDGSLRDPDAAADAVVDAVLGAAARAHDLVVVCDEVGCDGGGYPAETELFVRLAGSCCCRLASRADLVVEVTCGVAAVVKGPTC